MQRLLALVGRVASTDRPVLILGPTGSGKEVIAHEIHRLSLNPRSPFVDLNCSSIPENLMEAELFGHEKGAFTGATASRPGQLAAVGDGTLFLDEIGDMPPSLQPKLLRVLETRQFRGIGSTAPRTFHGRIVAATHRDLPRMVREGTFREDLFYRLNVFTLEIPELEKRPEDIPALVRHFARRQARPLVFQEDAIRLLSRTPWPGNVRQLRNLVDRVAVLCDQPCIDARALLPFLGEARQDSPASLDDLTDQLLAMEGEDKLSAVEHLLIDKVLRDCGGNKSAAARVLGVSRKIVERRIQACSDRLAEARQRCADGRRRIEVSEYGAAQEDLEAALSALRPLPPSLEERRLRFEILERLGVCRRSVEGWLSSGALEIYRESLRVGRGLVEPRELASILFGNWSVQLMRLELAEARDSATEIRLRGIDAQDRILQIDGGIALANTLFWQGEFEAALESIEEIRRIPDFGSRTFQHQGMDPVALATMIEALASLQTGDDLRLEAALEEMRRMCARSDHSFSEAIALQGCAWIECLRGRREEALGWAEQLLALARENGFAYYHGIGQVMAGYARSAPGRHEGIEARMRSGFDDEMALNGGLLFHSVFCLLLGRVLLEAGRVEQALAQVERGIEVAMERRELAYLGELLCLRARGLLAAGLVDKAEHELRNALETAIGIGSMPAREEAVAELTRLWRSTGRIERGQDPLEVLLSEGLIHATKEEKT